MILYIYKQQTAGQNHIRSLFFWLNRLKSYPATWICLWNIYVILTHFRKRFSKRCVFFWCFANPLHFKHIFLGKKTHECLLKIWAFIFLDLPNYNYFLLKTLLKSILECRLPSKIASCTLKQRILSRNIPKYWLNMTAKQQLLDEGKLQTQKKWRNFVEPFLPSI